MTVTVLDAAGVAPDLVRWAAEQTIRQHTEPDNPDRATGRCARCPDTDAGCALLAWAHAVAASKE